MAAQLTATNGLLRARRAGVQRARRQLLARARLAGDEHRAARVGDLREHAKAPAASPDRRPARRARARSRQASGVGLRLVARGVGFSTAATASSSVRDLERLDQEVARAGVHRPHGVRDLGAAAHRDDRRARRVHARGGQDLEAVDVRHADVGEDQVEAFFLQARVAADAVHRDNFMTRGPQNAAQAPAEGVFVVAEQNLSHVGHPRGEARSDASQVSHGSADLRRAFFACWPTEVGYADFPKARRNWSCRA